MSRNILSIALITAACLTAPAHANEASVNWASKSVASNKRLTSGCMKFMPTGKFSIPMPSSRSSLPAH